MIVFKNRYISGIQLIAISAAFALPTATKAAVLEEIIVTAQKRAESLQDVPISVTALGGEKMQQVGIKKIEDLQQFVPNLQMTETGISTQVYIRGIGTGNSQGFEQSVGQYIDGVYYGRQQLIRAPFLDLERVEVLRGPQSILFGKNSIAGALNMTSAKPTDDLQGYIQLNYEPEFSTREVLFAISGPLTDTLKGRFAVRSYDTDGYVDNTFLDDDEPARDDLAIRGTLRWEPNDNLDVTLKLERDTFDVDGRQIEIVQDDPAPLGAPIPANYGTILGLLGHPGAIAETSLNFKRQAGGFGVKEFSDNELDNATLTINYNLGKNTLTSVTGIVGYEFLELCDCDYAASCLMKNMISSVRKFVWLRQVGSLWTGWSVPSIKPANWNLKMIFSFLAIVFWGCCPVAPWHRFLERTLVVITAPIQTFGLFLDSLPGIFETICD